jgi:hypothetical protein
LNGKNISEDIQFVLKSRNSYRVKLAHKFNNTNQQTISKIINDNNIQQQQQQQQRKTLIAN